MSSNVRAHDVPPRWAFVRWLLRRHVRERGVVRCLFLFFFIFFYFFLVKMAFILRGPIFVIPATKLSVFIPFLIILLEFLLLKGECPSRF